MAGLGGGISFGKENLELELKISRLEDKIESLTRELIRHEKLIKDLRTSLDFSYLF